MGGRVESATLYIVGTPIGNLEDISYRAVRVLSEVDLIAAEDTRSARTLLAAYQIKTKTLSFFAGNESKRTSELLQKITEGKSVALISEAGMPCLADPGARLVARCIESGFAVDIVPGPSAITAALALSGLPCARFEWVGFWPRKPSERKQLCTRLRQSKMETVFFESPRRLCRTLGELADVVGEREVVVARELTKRHQELVRGTIGQAAEHFRQTAPRGELTVIIGGQTEEPAPDIDALREDIRRQLAAGASKPELAKTIGEQLGRSRAYRLVLDVAAQVDRRSPAKPAAAED